MIRLRSIWIFLAVAALVVSLAACTEKETKTDQGGSNNNLASQIVGTWHSEHIYINGEEHRMSMTIVMNADGTGRIGSSDETIRWSANGNSIQVTSPNSNTYSFTVTSITATNMVLTGSTIPGTEQQGAFEGHYIKATNS